MYSGVAEILTIIVDMCVSGAPIVDSYLKLDGHDESLSFVKNISEPRHESSCQRRDLFCLLVYGLVTYIGSSGLFVVVA